MSAEQLAGVSSAESMVEGVARAIAAEDGGPGNPLGFFPNGSPMRTSTWEEFMPEQHEAWRQMARAAIAAMREPTGAMLRSAFVAMNETPSGTWKRMKAEGQTPRRLFDVKMAPRWRAMIDAALSPSGEA